MDGWMDGWMDGTEKERGDGWIWRLMDEWMDRSIWKDGWIDR